MPPQFDLYVRRDTWLHRLDPRVKLLFVVVASALLFLWPRVWAALAMLGLCGLLLWRGRVPAGQVARVTRALAPLVILVFVLTTVFTPAGAGRAWLRLGPLAITPDAAALGAMLALRLLALAFIIFVWLFTTDQDAMVRGFLALRMPYAWGLTLALALRYVPIFAGLFEQVSDAQQARGLDLQTGSLWRRLRLYRPVLVAMIIIAARQSEQLGYALESRAFGATGVRRTVYRPLHMSRRDWLAVAALLALLAAGAGLRVL